MEKSWRFRAIVNCPGCFRQQLIRNADSERFCKQVFLFIILRLDCIKLATSEGICESKRRTKGKASVEDWGWWKRVTRHFFLYCRDAQWAFLKHPIPFYKRCKLDENDLFLSRSVLGGSTVMKLILLNRLVKSSQTWLKEIHN
jgi:hypothetical protein